MRRRSRSSFPSSSCGPLVVLGAGGVGSVLSSLLDARVKSRGGGGTAGNGGGSSSVLEEPDL